VLIVVWTFKLVEGADEQAFLEANELMQTEFVYQQPGFVRRTTARGKDGEWLVIGMWSSDEEAAAAGKLASADPIARAATSMVDPSSVQVKRFHTLD